MIQFNKNSIEREKTKTEKKRFVFPGSKMHTTPFLSYTIEHMSLKIKPDLVNKILIDCEQLMRIRAFKDLSEIVLDISDLKVTKVHSQSINILKFRCVDNKQVVIEFSEQLRAGSTVDIDISYSAGFKSLTAKKNSILQKLVFTLSQRMIRMNNLHHTKHGHKVKQLNHAPGFRLLIHLRSNLL